MIYRADIDGLRAVAVLAVLFYHFTGVSWFNGYMGVDIFFVISGFLITRIIAGELALGFFSLKNFYERRARRILPALFAMLLASSIAAYFLLLPSEMMAFAKSLIGAVLSVSNIVFWTEAGYFDLDAVNKPLLHTWSLGIEEQFYVLFPLILWVVVRYAQNTLRALMLGVWIASFAANIWLIQHGSQSTGFYLIFSRAWELLTGSLLAMDMAPASLIKKIQAPRLAWGGAVLLLAGFFWNADDKAFPGFYALMPVLGAAALIEAGRHGQVTQVQEWLNHRFAVGVGKISYSLYLWHWPLYVFASYYLLGDITWWQVVVLSVACFGLSYLSWRYIEQPVRTPNGFWTRRKIFIGALVGIVSFCVIGAFLLKEQGRGPLYQPQVATLLDVKEGGVVHKVENKDFPLVTLETFGSTQDVDRASIALWGDSHAITLAPAFIKLAQARQKTGVLITRNACFLTPEYAGRIRKQGECIAHTQQGLEYLIAHPRIKTVVLVNYWAGHLRFWEKRMDPTEAIAIRRQALLDVIDVLHRAGKKVVIVAQVPQIDAPSQNVPSLIARAELYKVDRDYRPTMASYQADQAEMMPIYEEIKASTPARVIWPHKSLCDETHCRIREDNNLYYYDDDHLSAYGAEKLAPLFAPLF